MRTIHDYTQEDCIETIRKLHPVNSLEDIPDCFFPLILTLRGYEGMFLGERGVCFVGDDKTEKELEEKYAMIIKIFYAEGLEKEYLADLQKITCDSIKEDLLEMCDSKKESLDEIRRYYRTFPTEPDYNIAQYGKLLVYYEQVRNFYDQCGYNTYGFNLGQYSDDAIWELYKIQVGIAVREIVKEYNLE